MRLDQLIYLVEIDRFKSISLAAEKLYVSQPTVSQAINSLEIELGKKLFTRSRSGTIPTEYGEEIIERAKEILFIVNDIKESSLSNFKLLTGNITIKGVPGFYTSLLSSALVSFKKKFPGITLKLFEGGSLEIEKDILAKTVDLGFVAVDNKDYFENNSKLIFKPLTTGNIMACVGQKSPLANKNSLSMQEIIKHPLISLKPGYQMYETIMDSLKEYGNPDVFFYSGNSSAGKQILMEGFGVGFCSSITIKNDPYFMFDKLKAIPLSDKDLGLYYGYLILKDKHFSNISKEFIKIVKTYIT